MKAEQNLKVSLDEHIGCFGEYIYADTVCRKLCALRIRCAIEHEQNFRLEILEDLASADLIHTKTQ
jgi:hypothetical protein